MTRGSYTSRPRPLVDWTLGRYARSRFHEAVDPITGKAAFVAVSALKAGRGARDAYAGSKAFTDRGEIPVSIVGASWWHGTVDRERAIAQISTEFLAFGGDLLAWQEVNSSEATAQWITTAVKPTFEEWKRFVDRERASWWTKAATSWDTFEKWHERLRGLRDLARAHGIALHSAEPVTLPKTIWQDGATGNGGTVTAWLGVLKIVVLGAIAVTGGIALYTGLRNLRGEARRSLEVREEDVEVSC